MVQSGQISKNVNYEICGWHDNYTGNEQYNDTVRWKRVEEVRNYLNLLGISSEKLVCTTNPMNFYNGREAVALDRVVTIRPVN